MSALFLPFLSDFLDALLEHLLGNLFHGFSFQSTSPIQPLVKLVRRVQYEPLHSISDHLNIEEVKLFLSFSLSLDTLQDGYFYVFPPVGFNALIDRAAT